MALRKELVPDISVDNQQQDQSTHEDELPSLLRSTSSACEKRRKERDSQVKQKEMTEEEMMDLALQLSKQEASNTALRQQREDEDVMKAIQESMVSQKQPSLKPPNKSLLGAASTSLGSRRKLSYTNGEKLPQEGDMNSGDESITSSKKQKRSTDSSLLEMPDLSQTQNLSCQNLLCSPESFSLNLDSPQSSDSTHIDDSQLQMSPVFPLTGCKAEVHIKRLNRDLVETCKTSGFVMFSEDSIPSTQNSAQPKSPVFPQSNRVSSPKSPVFLEDEAGHGGESEQSPKFVKSQIYGRTAEHEKSPNASEPPACENEEFGFSSQESFIPTLRSCPPQSPVFPKTPLDMLAINADTDQEPAERGDECSVSPVFGSTEAQRTELQEKPGELRGSEHDQNIPDCRKDRKSNGVQTAECNRPLSKSEVNGKSDGCNSAGKEVTSDMTLVWSEEDDDDETPVVSPSPVFAEQEKVVPRVSQPGSSVNDVSEAGQKCSQQPCCTSGQELYPVSRQGVTRESPPPGESSGDQMIHYYWGVPFCPRGLDPDTYTQVIVAQMEVYEKSLKQAQRGLLRKAEWGKAIQPEPEKSLSPEAPAESPQSGRPRRRGLRLRSSKRSKAPEFDEEEEKRDDGEEEQQEKEEGEEQKDGDEEQMDTDDCEVCPETQLSDNNSTTELSLVTDTETQISSQHPQKSPELSEIKMIIKNDTPTRSMPQELEQRMKTQTDSSMEENSPECREDAEKKTAGELEKVTENKKNQDVVKLEDKGLQRSESPELEADVVPHSPETSIDCPICQGSFPASKIEMHAAYCDGEVTVVNQRVPESKHVQDSTKPRRKRMKRTEASSEELTTLSDVCRRQEKCYICQKNVPLKDYSRHTELCVQRGTFRRAAKGNLLSALEQTESRNSGAGPSGSKPQPEAVIDLRDDDDDDEDEGEQEVSGYRVSNSPIRSFTPISEATGCLIDFRKQQRTKKPTQRRR